MRKKSLLPIILIYSLSLFIIISLLVIWTIYVLHSQQVIGDLLTKLGQTNQNLHWVILIVGCLLMVALIVGLSLQLAQSISDIRYTNKQQDFIANMTHELKSPLSAMKINCQTLLQEELPFKQQQFFLNHILQQIERTTLLVNNVLEIGRLSEQKFSFKLEPLSLMPFFANTLPEIKTRVESHQLHFDSEIDVPVMILGHSLSLYRIIDNLVDNAIKASQPGQTILCRAVCKNKKEVEIEIVDQGIGISKKMQSKIFDRFYQIGSEIRNEHKGSGLGLAIVKALVVNMRGKINVSSKGEKQGAKFIVTLPILQKDAL